MNTNFTKDPIVGTPLTPSVIRQIHTAVRRYMPIAGNGIRTSVTAGGTIISAIPAPAPKMQKDNPLPYEVRWAHGENDGEGAWVIWLPYMPTSTTDIPAFGPLLMVGNQYVDFLQGTAALSPAQTLPSGWFVLRNDAEGGAVYMNIVVPTFWSDAGHVTAAISTTPDSTLAGQDDYLHFSVLIATMTTDEDTGAKRIKQAVDSTIIVEGPIFGPNGEGIWPPDGGGESTPQPFDIDDDVVVRCYAPAPCGTMLVGANYAIDGTKGDILVHVDRNSQTGVYTLTVDQTHRAESPTHHEWTLYQYRGGDVVCDCRPRVLPLIRFDDKSLDIDATNHNLQIKGFDNPANAASSSSLADDLQAQTAVQGHVLFRDASGALKYKPIGQLSGGGHSFCGAFSYDPDTHTIKDGMYLRARQWYEVAEATVSAAGYAYLEVGMEATSFTVSIVTGASSIPARTRYKTYVPLYWFNANLEPTHDYRGAPTIQIWEYMS